MNFKIFFFIFLSTLSACGVKAPPLKYPETAIDSYVRGYTGSDPTPDEIARNKKAAEKTPGPVAPSSPLSKP